MSTLNFALRKSPRQANIRNMNFAKYINIFSDESISTYIKRGSYVYILLQNLLYVKHQGNEKYFDDLEMIFFLFFFF